MVGFFVVRFMLGVAEGALFPGAYVKVRVG